MKRALVASLLTVAFVSACSSSRGSTSASTTAPSTASAATTTTVDAGVAKACVEVQNAADDVAALVIIDSKLAAWQRLYDAYLAAKQANPASPVTFPPQPAGADGRDAVDARYTASLVKASELANATGDTELQTAAAAGRVATGADRGRSVVALIKLCVARGHPIRDPMDTVANSNP